MTVNSGTAVLERNAPVYMTSDEPTYSNWGQPAASHYSFLIVGTIMFGNPIAGVYLPSPGAISTAIDSRLAEEFAAWEAASDEALVNFEAMLE